MDEEYQRMAANSIAHEAFCAGQAWQQAAAAQALDLLMLLSALESWAFSTGKPLPDYLLERLNTAILDLSGVVLEDDA